ncbi:alpha/beta hydrolase [Sphingobium tyrosinilyticum]|uniref:Alpha/beta hydrolase n=1 Tax=Sphingobium tyrosinilyticum TaxID=2715436 RepID=A0ABV9EY08_9SPHN
MDDPKGVTICGRTVPFPKSISPQARAFLASLVGPDGLPLNAMPQPAPDDLEGWAKSKETAGKFMTDLSSALSPHLRSSVESIEVAGVRVHLATPADPFPDDRVYLDIHGGGLVHGEGEFCRTGARRVADQHGVSCYAVDYRMPPEHPYPAPLDDCVAVYRELLNQYAPENIIIGGASAGGNLAAAAVLRARDEGLPLPAAVILLTPELDLTETGDSFETNQLVDVMLPRPLMNANLLYAAGHDLADPYLSPLFGDFSAGFPPTFLQAGTRDLFLSNAVRMHRALLRARVPVELHIFEGMPHGGFGGSTAEDLELSSELQRFVRAHWGATPQSG